MTSARQQQLKQLFDAALSRTPQERVRFLDEACASDEALRREVETLLASHAHAATFMETPVVAQMANVLVGDARQLTQGERVGHYEIISALGAGGMGEVYLAQDTKLQRKVALKLLPVAAAADAQANKRLLREAQTAATLDHPHICAIHEIGEAGGRSFICMQYVEGETLAAQLQRVALSVREAVNYAVQIADALTAAHAHKIIHRDIKPANIIVTLRGQVKVLDFGLAKFVTARQLVESEAETASLLSVPGAIMGTVPYMSPEQVRGESLDERSDVFSFGVTLYEMLSGCQPFACASTAETTAAVLTREPPPLVRYAADAPAELQRITRKCLEKKREERYQTAQDLLLDLRRLQQRLEVEAELERRAAPALPERALAEGRAMAETIAFNAAPTVTDSAAPSTANEDNRTDRRKTHKLAAIAALSILILAAIGFGLWFFSQRNSHANQIKSLAILPLKSLDAGGNYLGLGIADAVIRRISQTGEMTVRPTSAVRRYLNEETDALTAARELNADAVLEGSVQRADDSLRVSVNLLRTSDGESLWADKFDMRMTDIFTIQDTVAQQVASRLRLQLDPAQQSRLTKRYTSNPVAYEFYLKGVYNFDRRVSLTKNAQMDVTANFFKQAIEADPNFALAHAQLAYAYAVKAVFIEPTEPVWAERAKEEIDRAQTLDPQLAETHLARFQLLYSASEGYQGEAAVRELLLAQQLNPNVGHGELGYLYIHLGLEDLAARETQRAHDIDPTSEFAKEMTLLMYEAGSKYDEYAAHRELYHDDYMETWYLMGTGRLDEAQKKFDEWSAKRPNSIDLPANKALLLALKGDFRAAEAAIPSVLNRHPVKDPLYHHHVYDIARIYALEGKSGEAVKWLREANAAGFQCYPLFERDPYLNRIRQAPEFSQFMAEMKAQNERYRREFALTAD